MNKVPFQGKRKLLLLHGPAIEASRRKLQELRKKFNPDSVLVFEKDEDEETILTNLKAQSLFDDERLVIVENPSEVFKLPVGDMTNDTADKRTTLVLWFDHKVDTKEWPGFEDLFFPEQREVSVFPFLDYLAAKDQKAFLEMEKLKTGGFDIFYLLTMTFYLLRSLAVTPRNALQFVKDKLQRQRKNFTEEKVTDLYKELLEIDFKLKSGLLEKSQAEFLLINKFLN